MDPAEIQRLVAIGHAHNSCDCRMFSAAARPVSTLFSPG
jgi:hypothetical protein